MPLIDYASPWTPDDGNKKRTPTIRKLITKQPFVPAIDVDTGSKNNAPTPNNVPLTQDDVQAYNDERGTLVHELLNQMSSLDAENDGAHLANFTPLSPPDLSQRKPVFQDNTEYTSNSEVSPQSENSSRPFYSDNRSLANLSNYQNIYENPTLFQKNKPYYANMGISNTQNGDSKLMERINYMIHLMEEQQHEKTANISEEFLLYTFLGVFVIYVVDTFSRNGKYVR